MSIVLQTGCAARSVTSAAEVPLLGANTSDTAGYALANASRWTLAVTTNHDVTVRVYVAAGPNAGLALVTGWTATAGASTPYTLQVDGAAHQRVWVTAQAASTTAAVNADLRAVTP
jgi:hypothetical protein